MKIAFVLFVVFSSNLQAAVIDAFVSAGQMVQSSESNRGTISETAETSGGIFEQRTLSISGGGQRLGVAANAGAIEYGVADGNTGYFELIYTSSVPINLLGDGATSFQFVFESGYTSFRFPTSLYIDSPGQRGKTSLGGSTFGAGEIFRSESGSFSIDVPFDEILGVDLTSVTRVSFEGFRISGDSGFVLSEISTVPEPASMLSFLIASVVSIVRRRRTE